MKPVVAVEESLSSVADYLAARGCEIRRIKDFGVDANQLRGCHAMVVTGLDNNFAGYEDVDLSIPVISAHGQTPDAILADVMVRARLGEL